MCSYHTERIEVTGSAKGPAGWFPLRLATVYYDHPQHTAADHTLNIDFLNPDLGPSTRVAVELSEDSARALAAAIHTALSAAPALDRPAATAPAAKDP
jgi:Family of unknown function (DUF6295)